MGFLDFLLRAIGPPPGTGCYTSTGRPLSRRDIQAVDRSIQSMVRVINESMAIANRTANPETKASRIQVVRTTIARIRDQQRKFPFIQDGNLSRILADLERVEGQPLPEKKKRRRPRGPRKVKA